MDFAVIDPPAIFDYEPTNYAVMYAPMAEMVVLCGWATVACARPAKRIIIIALDGGLSAEESSRVIRHEKAHLNGWRH